MNWVLPAIIGLGGIAVVAFIIWLVLGRGSGRDSARPWLVIAAVAGIGCAILGVVLALGGA